MASEGCLIHVWGTQGWGFVKHNPEFELFFLFSFSLKSPPPFFPFIIIIIIYPLTTKVIGAPQMTLQPVSSNFPCSPLPSGTWLNQGLSIPWCCLPTSSSVCHVFFPLSLCLTRWVWPDLMNRRHDHTTAVCVSLQWSGGLYVVWSPAGSWHGLLVANMVFVWDA